MKPAAILAAIIAVAGLAFGVYAFVANASPYVSAKQAAAQPGVPVHVAGEIVHSSAVTRNGRFTFVLVDDAGDSLTVVYDGMKPGNFDSAPTASVAGSYEDGVFVATKITTQCPSKYESEARPVVAQ